MRMSRFGLATAALAATACLSAPAFAADLYGGSIKDAPVVVSSPGHCYIRGDVGYSWSRDPDVKWTVTDPVIGSLTFGQFVTDAVHGREHRQCLAGRRRRRLRLGIARHPRRADARLSRQARHRRHAGPVEPRDDTSDGRSAAHLRSDHHPDVQRLLRPRPASTASCPTSAPASASPTTRLSGVSFTGNPALANVIDGDSQVVAGLVADGRRGLSAHRAHDARHRLPLLDMGKAESGIIDNLGFTNPQVRIDDLTAHEFKVGLRFAFGGGEPCCCHDE